MKTFFGKFVHFTKKEMVLCIAFVLAAVSMFFVTPSAEYIDYIDFRVIVLLFCLMTVVSGLYRCGLFNVVAKKMFSGEKRFWVVSLYLVALPFFFSMFVTNDVSLIAFVPFAILVLDSIGKHDKLIFIIVLQTLAANLGSMLTPFGNPQNLFLYFKFNLSFSQFISIIFPYALLSMFLLFVTTLFLSKEKVSLTLPSTQSEITDKKSLVLFLIMFVLCILSVLRVLDFRILLGIVLVALLVFSRASFKTVDYCLLFTFVCFFVFSGNLAKIPQVENIIENLTQQSTLLSSVLFSQVISNVPAAVLLSNFTTDYSSLIIGTNIGGLGTIVASLASLISFKFYANTPKAKSGKFLLIFTVANIVMLALMIGLSFII